VCRVVSCRVVSCRWSRVVLTHNAFVGQISMVDLSQVMEVLSGNTEKLTEDQLGKLLHLAEAEDQLKLRYHHFKKWWV